MKDIDQIREDYDDRLIEEEGKKLEKFMDELYKDHDESSEDMIDNLWKESHERIDSIKR